VILIAELTSIDVAWCNPLVQKAITSDTALCLVEELIRKLSMNVTIFVLVAQSLGYFCAHEA